MAEELESIIARLSGSADAATYRATNEALIARLDEFEAPFAIDNESAYAKAYAVKSMLNGLACFTFNSNHPAENRVWAMEGAWAKALAKYNRRHLLKSGDASLVARYLLWRHYLLHVDARAAFVLARRFGILFRDPRASGATTSLYVVGLNRAVGDNVFTVDRRGRQHRQFGKTIGRQAFRVVQRFPWSGDEAAAFLASLPELDTTYGRTDIGDHKHAARGSAFSREAKRRAMLLLSGVSHTDLDVAPRVAHPLPEPQQFDLLAA